MSKLFSKLKKKIKSNPLHWHLQDGTLVLHKDCGNKKNLGEQVSIKMITNYSDFHICCVCNKSILMENE